MIAYLDCFAGISSDMTLGALVDSGVPKKWLQVELEKIPLTGFELGVESIICAGVKAQTVSVKFTGVQPRLRSVDIFEIIANSPYADTVKTRSLTGLQSIVQAYHHLYGQPTQAIPWHEINWMNAIVAIVGSALALEFLGIETIFASALPMGSRHLQHWQARYFIPSPITLEILKGWPIYGNRIQGDMVTPIGAAIVAGFCEYCAHLPTMSIDRVGYGAGSNDLAKQSNCLRIISGRSRPNQRTEQAQEDLVILEACIDDMNPEIFGYLMERLFENGALDVVWQPIFMKKNRPGTKIEVLCGTMDKDTLIQQILSETTSLGVRFYKVKRRKLQRRTVKVDSPWGPIQVKQVTDLNGDQRIVPEYEVCRRIALEHHLPLKSVYAELYKLN